MGKNVEKFCLLMWKNWKLQYRRPLQTVLEIMAPIIFSVLLIVLRSLVDPVTNPSQTYPAFNPIPLFLSQYYLKPNAFHLRNMTIAYSPTSNKVLDEAMNRLRWVTTVVKGFRNSKELEENFGIDDSENKKDFAGIQFDDDLSGKETIPLDIEVSIRFPAQLRGLDLADEKINISSLLKPRNKEDVVEKLRQVFRVRDWVTNVLFPLYDTPGPREWLKQTGATPNYFGEGFLGLQVLVTYVLGIVQTNKSAITLYHNIKMQRFPFSTWREDPLLPALISFTGMLIMLSYVYTCINTVKSITVEKEKQLKEAMKIMGLPNWLHWTAWFIKTFCFLLISVIITVIILTVAWYPNNEFSIFTYTNPLVLFSFLVLYICASITFCFFVSSFFSKANTASTVAGLLWFLSYAPYLFLQLQYDQLSLSTKLVVSLGSNTAMAYGFQMLLMHESTGEGEYNHMLLQLMADSGSQWSNIWTPITPDDSLTLGLVMIMLIADTIIYLIIALYVEAVLPGEFGTPQPWYFPFTYTYWFGKPQTFATDDFVPTESKVEFFEIPDDDLVTGIQISNLRKLYGKKVAVKNLSLSIYENQITALLGHNGAGKTTTMSILTGIIPPTSGTAYINGFDIRTNMEDVRANLGLCPQYNVLFDDLTVKEHLYFFSKLKSVPSKDIPSEIDKHVKLLDLEHKINSKASTLSGGMKRKLSVGIALCGGSKTVLLDEPTAGMDPCSRRALWDLLQAQKVGRCILFTTHYMDEADLLGDRIAIMVTGDLKCCGASFFLKKKFGSGYNLILEKGSKCNVSDVTTILRYHIPEIRIHRNIGSELIYLLKDEDAYKFEKMLQDLEANLSRLNIRGYGISLTTMEDVFLNVGASETRRKIEESRTKIIDATVQPQYKRNIEPIPNISMEVLKKFVTLTGLDLISNQYLAMLMKKSLYFIRTWILQVIQILLPVAFLIIAILVTRNMRRGKDVELPKLPITLDSYRNPIIVFEDSLHNNFSINYYEYLKEYIVEVTSVEKSMLSLSKDDPIIIKKQYMVGASFTLENNTPTMTAWFNNNPYHTPPLALALVLNAIYKTIVSPKHSITFANHPLPLTAKGKFEKMLKPANSQGFQFAFNVAFSMAFVSSFYVLFTVKERVCKSKHLQFVSGLRGYIFWTSCYLFDMLTFMVTSLALVITLVCFQEEGFKNGDEIGRVLLLLFVFGLAFLPMIYFASYLFDIPSTGYTRMTLFSIFTGVAAFLIVEILSVPDLNLQYVADDLHWFLLVIPHYTLANGINNIYITHLSSKLCHYFVDNCLKFVENYTEDACWELACMGGVSETMEDSCCERDFDFYKWKAPGIGRNLFFSFLLALILFLLLIIYETRFFSKIKRLIFQKPLKFSSEEADEDADVLEEKRLIQTSDESQLIQDYALVLKNVVKRYKKLVAVKNLCLGVKQFECFGFLGVNGAGKTSTFKMITGDRHITSGEIWVKSYNVKTHLKQVQKNIGYCPQFDALLPELTAKETLMMFAMIRGVRLRDCSYLAFKLAQDFDFQQHSNKMIKHLSGGNKRKISTAISLIGDPPVLCLDEPTAGMDPITKRYLWNILGSIRGIGKCIIFTSHSMEECEALCTRLAIMVNGDFKCIGSLQHLKNKFTAGYTLTLKIKREQPTKEVEEFMKSTFPSAKLKEKHQELITFHIGDKKISCAKMFGVLEKAKHRLNIEDYSLGQTNLEQIFLSLTQYQA